MVVQRLAAGIAGAGAAVFDDLLRRRRAVRLIRADDARRAALDPADRVEAGFDPAVAVAAPAAVERHAVDRIGMIADRRDHQAAGDVEGLAGADRPAVFDPRLLHPDAFDPLAAQDLDRAGAETEMHALGAAARFHGGEVVQGRQIAPGHAQIPVAQRGGKILRHVRRQLRRVQHRGAVLELAHLAQFDIAEFGMVRRAPAEHIDVADRRGVDCRGGIVGQIGRRHLLRRLGQNPGDVDRDVAHADHRDRLRLQRRIEIAEIRMAVVPADEGGDPQHARLVVAGNPERPVDRGAGRQHNRVIHGAQRAQADIVP